MAKMNIKTIDRTSVGLASELSVASKLIKLGCQVSLTLGHTKSVDIHASINGKTHSIQVKGAQKNKTNSNSCSWIIKKGNIDPKMIYIFVNLNLNIPNGKEDIYVIRGIDLIPLILGNPPQEYVYSNKLKNYLDDWSKL